MIKIELPEMSLHVEEGDVYKIVIWDDSCEPGRFTEEHVVDSMAEVLDVIQNFLRSATGDLV